MKEGWYSGSVGDPKGYRALGGGFRERVAEVQNIESFNAYCGIKYCKVQLT